MLGIRGTSHGPVTVCLSVTSRCSTKTAKHRITQTTPHDSPGTSFLKPKISAKFDRSNTCYISPVITCTSLADGIAIANVAISFTVHTLANTIFEVSQF